MVDPTKSDQASSSKEPGFLKQYGFSPPPQSGISFRSMLEKFIPDSNQEKPQEKPQEKTAETVASGDLKGRRIEIANQIGKAVKEGKVEELHKLQAQYDSITAQLRSSVETAYTSPQTQVAEHPVPPLLTPQIPMPRPQGLEGQAAKPEPLPASKTEAKEELPLPKIQTPAAKPAPPSKAEATQEQSAPKPQTPAAKPLPKLETAQEPPVEKDSSSIVEPKPASVPKAGISQNIPSQVKPAENPFGVPDSVWQKVCQNDHVKSALLTMPDQAVQLYKQITPKEKEEMSKHLNEKTHVFFFTIDNRQAFITGQAMGRDVFEYMTGAIDKQVEDGKLSLEQGMRQQSALNILKSLSPDQREGFVALVDGEILTH